MLFLLWEFSKLRLVTQSSSNLFSLSQSINNIELICIFYFLSSFQLCYFFYNIDTRTQYTRQLFVFIIILFSSKVCKVFFRVEIQDISKYIFHRGYEQFRGICGCCTWRIDVQVFFILISGR